MALITCPECGGKVSSTCDTCVHCGYHLKNQGHNGGNEIPIVERGGPGFMTGLATFDIVLGAIIAIGFGAAAAFFMSSPGSIWVASLICFLLALIGLAGVIVGIYELTIIGKAGRLSGPCVIYNKAENIVEMTKLGGVKVRIRPIQIIGAKAGLSTDYMFIVWYSDKNKDRKKAKLGYALNREAGVQALLNLKNKHIWKDNNA